MDPELWIHNDFSDPDPTFQGSVSGSGSTTLCSAVDFSSFIASLKIVVYIFFYKIYNSLNKRSLIRLFANFSALNSENIIK
jgi:hypothetical protein